MSDDKVQSPLTLAIARRRDALEQAVSTRSLSEQALAFGGLYVLDRCVRVLDATERLVDEQRASVRRGRQILEMFPPIITKLGELVELELTHSRNRLRRRG